MVTGVSRGVVDSFERTPCSVYCKTNARGRHYVTDGEATIDQNGASERARPGRRRDSAPAVEAATADGGGGEEVERCSRGFLIN